MFRGGDGKNGDMEWEKFRDIVKECTKDVCGMRHVVVVFQCENGW